VAAHPVAGSALLADKVAGGQELAIEAGFHGGFGFHGYSILSKPSAVTSPFTPSNLM
jgi:hypothetical protein